MQFWNAIPLFRLIIPFILGILFSEQYYSENIIYVLLCLTILLISIQWKNNTYHFRWVFGLVASVIVFTMGVWLCHNSLTLNNESHFSKHISDENIMILELIEVPQEKQNFTKIVAEVLAINQIYSRGKILVYADVELDELDFGSVLLVKAFPNDIKNTLNPNQFDFRSFCYHRDIGHQIFLDKNKFVLLKNNKPNIVFKKVFNLRKKLMSWFQSTNLTPEQKAICRALLLGDKSVMDHELKQAFSSAGVMHILAVSGLHVGILFMLLNTLFSFCDNFKYLKELKVIIILFGLWSYALLTAMSPSVLRAATMFSFIVVAQTLNRNSNIYNTLAASAFLLLMVNPHFVYEIGFQLSYMAVLGIVAIYPKFYDLLLIKIKLLDYFWQLLCVSVAAQLATLPLSIYYFHYFPNYFFIANIIVVPLVPIIIYLGFLFVLFHDLKFIYEPIYLLLKKTLDVLLTVIDSINQLPYSRLEFLYLNRMEVVLCYTLLVFSVAFLYYRRKWLINVTFLVFIVLQLSFLNNQLNDEKRKQIIFYSLNRHTAFGVVEEKEAVFFMDNKLIKDHQKQEFNLFNHWSFLGLKNRHVLSSDHSFSNNLAWKNGNYLQLAHFRILHVDSTYQLVKNQLPIDIDYCLISNPISLKKLIANYRIEKVLLDSKLSLYQSQILDLECQKMGVNYVNLKTNGALVINY